MILFILYVILSTSGLLLFKLGSGNVSMVIKQSIFSLNISLISILGLVCYLISFILWMYIISKSKVSIIVPLGVAFTNIAVLIGSTIILKEAISIRTVLGTIIILLGIFVLNSQ